jgi:hypothetical protein
MIIYALANRAAQETVELFTTREAAEAAVRQVIKDEPTFRPDAFVAVIELPEPSLN